VCIWANDKDLAQCVRGSRVVQVDRRAKEIRDADGVRRKFGVEPELIPDFLALVGDAQDGYPGIAGIGRATATRLAEQARADGVDLDHAAGPWRAALLWRNLDDVPVMTNDRTGVKVDTIEHATHVAGLLNWCGVVDLDPVPELLPWPQGAGPGGEPAGWEALAGIG